MPNQRSPHKRHVGGYLDEELYAAVAALARARYRTITEVLEELIAEGIERRAPREQPPAPAPGAPILPHAKTTLRHLSH